MWQIKKLAEMCDVQRIYTISKLADIMSTSRVKRSIPFQVAAKPPLDLFIDVVNVVVAWPLRPPLRNVVCLFFVASVVLRHRYR